MRPSNSQLDESACPTVHDAPFRCGDDVAFRCERLFTFKQVSILSSLNLVSNVDLTAESAKLTDGVAETWLRARHGATRSIV